MSWTRLILAFLFAPGFLAFSGFLIMVAFGVPGAIWFVQFACLMAYGATIALWLPLYVFKLRHREVHQADTYILAGLGTGVLVGLIPFVLPVLAIMNGQEGFGLPELWLLFSNSAEFFVYGLVYAGLSGAVFWLIAFFHRAA